jgi:hypothetical protein
MVPTQQCSVRSTLFPFHMEHEPWQMKGDRRPTSSNARFCLLNFGRQEHQLNVHCILVSMPTYPMSHAAGKGREGKVVCEFSKVLWMGKRKRYGSMGSSCHALRLHISRLLLPHSRQGRVPFPSVHSLLTSTSHPHHCALSNPAAIEIGGLTIQIRRHPPRTQIHLKA